MRRLGSSSISIRRVIFRVVVVCVFGAAANGAPWDGSGTMEDPYKIWDACDMQAIGADANYWDAHFELMADINLGGFTGTSFNIIGERYYDPCLGWVENPFTGVFDGKGHSISNFSYDSAGTNYLGLFGYVNDSDAEIRNVGMIAADVNNAGYLAGALVGYIKYGSITGCYVRDSKVCGELDVGGIAGGNSFGEIQDCNSVGTIVIGYEGVGGLIGSTGTEGSISNCYSRNNRVIGYGSEIGGLVGYNEGTISECYTRGSTINGEWSCGGLVGLNYDTGIISSCYSEDNTVTGGEGVGGLAGDNWSTITKCHSDCLVLGGGEGAEAGVLVGGASGGISKCYSVGRCIGADWDEELIHDCFWIYAGGGMHIGIELSTTEMMTKDTFTDAGWDFNTPIWTIDEGNDYPRLWWEEVVSPGRYGGGRGLPAEPYLIYTAEDMQAIGANRIDWHKHFKLMADIDLSGYSGEEFNIIGEYLGTQDAYDMPFIGTFDGDGHTISNFTYSSEEDNIGIFEYLGRYSVIKDLGLIDPNVEGGDRVGSLVGRHTGKIINCYVKDGTVWGGTGIGGLAGNSGGGIFRCYSTASVTGEDMVGCLAGATWDYIDLFSGEPQGRGKTVDCYSRGEVSGDTGVGGLVGWNYVNFGGWGTGAPAKISNCYSTGAVSGNSYFGGLIGLNNGDVNNCFWDVNSSGQESSSGGTGKTTTDMQTMSIFTDAGWDFVGEVINGPNDIWDICDGTNYPKLAWQIPLLGDFVCPDGVEYNDLAVLCEQWLLKEIPADFWPDGGDGIVNLFDWAVFAAGWESTPDIDELAIFVEQWLQRGASFADIAPAGGDGIVNMLDFAALAENWLAGL